MAIRKKKKLIEITEEQDHFLKAKVLAMRESLAGERVTEALVLQGLLDYWMVIDPV